MERVTQICLSQGGKHSFAGGVLVKIMYDNKMRTIPSSDSGFDGMYG
jgi:hypothetical protein